MGIKNKISEEGVYYLTLTVIDWVDVFTRPVYKHIIIDSLKYCQQQKGLEIFAWCLMTNHLHMIAKAKEKFHLSDILRDFKKYVNKAILIAIQDEPESRRKWMLNRFEYAGRYDKKIKYFKFWKEGNEAKEIYSSEFFDQKLDYIHNNPVKAEIVEEAHEYLYSSAKNYSGKKGLLEVILV